MHPTTSKRVTAWRLGDGAPVGFTLVEILVVLSLIALLISLHLPAMSSARKAARDVACKSNQRQIHVATMAYTVDNLLYLRPPQVAGVSSPYHKWYGLYNRYLFDQNDRFSVTFACPEGLTGPRKGGQRIVDVNNNNPEANSDFWTGYTMHEDIVGKGTGSAQKWLRTADLRDADALYLEKGDVWYSGNHNWYGGPQALSMQRFVNPFVYIIRDPYLAFRHGGIERTESTMNVSFMDGSVTTVSYQTAFNAHLRHTVNNNDSTYVRWLQHLRD